MNSSFIILLLKKDPGLHNEYIMVKEVEEKLNLIFLKTFCDVLCYYVEAV